MTRPRGAFRTGSVAAILLAACVAACGWDPMKPFERESPQVREAIKHYEAGAPDAATSVLAEYLTTGRCEEGNIGTPGRLHERPNGTFDLGLSLFEIAETYGRRFGEEEAEGEGAPPPAPGANPNTNLKGLRAGNVECALRVVRAIADDPSQPAGLRARAHYLEGNLLFLTSAYDEAVKAYDKAIAIAPGMEDAGPTGANDFAGRLKYAPDPVGRDAAWNRAIALRRHEDKKKDAGNDAAPNDGGSGEGGDGQNQDQNKDDDSEKKDDPNRDSGKGDPPDAGKDAGGSDDEKPKEEPPKEEDAGAPPPPSRQSQDERILDRLENAPTVQQEAAKKQARSRKMRGMSDK